jgi:hypothetical protein
MDVYLVWFAVLRAKMHASYAAYLPRMIRRLCYLSNPAHFLRLNW